MPGWIPRGQARLSPTGSRHPIMLTYFTCGRWCWCWCWCWCWRCWCWCWCWAVVACDSAPLARLSKRSADTFAKARFPRDSRKPAGSRAGGEGRQKGIYQLLTLHQWSPRGLLRNRICILVCNLEFTQQLMIDSGSFIGYHQSSYTLS